MTHSATTTTGYTDTEKQLLQSMVDEMRLLIAAVDWSQRLPITTSRSYILKPLGNPVRLTLKLYQYSSKTRNQAEFKLFLDVYIQGTDKERWASVDGGFFVSIGSTTQVANDIHSLHADIHPMQVKLAEEYRGAFYNS